MQMWITQEVFHNLPPESSKKHQNISVDSDISRENQSGGHANSKTIVDNSIVDKQSVENPQKTDSLHGKNIDNESSYPQGNMDMQIAKSQLAGISADLSTYEKAQKQRENGSFSGYIEQWGQSEENKLWKTQKLSTNTVEKMYELGKNNGVLTAMKVKSEILKGLERMGEQLLFSAMIKLDFLCRESTLEIRGMKHSCSLVAERMQIVKPLACGFEIQLVEVEIFSGNIQAEIDKMKKYFGEDLLKII